MTVCTTFAAVLLASWTTCAAVVGRVAGMTIARVAPSITAEAVFTSVGRDVGSPFLKMVLTTGAVGY